LYEEARKYEMPTIALMLVAEQKSHNLDQIQAVCPLCVSIRLFLGAEISTHTLNEKARAKDASQYFDFDGTFETTWILA
jgi:hypothetical protein